MYKLGTSYPNFFYLLLLLSNIACVRLVTIVQELPYPAGYKLHAKWTFKKSCNLPVILNKFETRCRLCKKINLMSYGSPIGQLMYKIIPKINTTRTLLGWDHKNVLANHWTSVQGKLTWAIINRGCSTGNTGVATLAWQIV